MKRNSKPLFTYTDPVSGVLVKSYPEKATKHSTWMRGESFCGIKARIDADTGTLFTSVSRKPGKY